MSEGLKLSAIEADDLTILSAAMEGAITSPGEMSYTSSSRMFTLTSSRFMWEKFDGKLETGNRIRSGLLFCDVLSIKAAGVFQKNPTQVMELLSITCEAGDDGVADIWLNFAGGGTLRLSVECINIALTDVGEAWTADHIPVHVDDDAENNQVS